MPTSRDPNTVDPSGAPTLEYGRPHPRRPWWNGPFVWILILVGLGYCGWRWGLGTYRRLDFLGWQRQCLSYSDSADRVVYFNANVSFEASPPFPVEGAASSAISHVANCWTQFSAMSQLYTPVTKINAASGWSVVFLHELRTPSAKPMLVCVQAFSLSSGLTVSPGNLDIGATRFLVTVINPAAFRAAPQLVPQTLPSHVLLSAPSSMRIYAGQLSPADRSGFTIRYETTSEGFIDGKIDDAGNVVLAPRAARGN